jgi:hypothetical protein
VSISCHVVVTRVDNRLTITLNIEHTSAKDMTGIVGSDFDVSNLKSLMELDRLNFIYTVLDHLRAEAIYFALLSHRDFSKVFEHERDNGLGRWCGDDRSTVAHSFTEIGQRATMI